MKKSVESYIPKKKETKLVQVHLDLDTHKKIEAILDQKHWTWPDLLRGLLSQWLDEKPEQRKIG